MINKQKTKKCNKRTNGITLIALVVTIIVLLILAGISISMLAGNNGIITRAGEAKEETVVGQEKELVKLAFMSATVKKLESNITSRELQDELDISVGEGKTKVSGSRRLKVKFEDTKNEYTVSTKGVVSEYKEAELTDIYVALCRDKDEENDENGNGNILVFSNNKEDISNSYNIIEEYDNIKGKEYGYNKSDELFTYAPWHNISYPIELNYIFSVDFLNEIVPENTADWFDSLFYLNNLKNIQNLNTSKVTDMSYMFKYCRGLDKLDLSTFDTCNVTNMCEMFSNCNCLTTIDLSSFDTSKVTDMFDMFGACYALINLDVSSFDTREVLSMESMFSSCDNLESLDLSSFNTKKVTYMSNMFKSCYNIFELDLTAFQTSNVIDMSMMFMNCESLKTIYVSDKFDVTKVSTSDNMFDNCNVLEGEKGTKFIDCYDDLGINKDYSKLDKSYAHVDGGISNPGYFTANNN